MANVKADPKVSEGARYARKVVRQYLRREIKAIESMAPDISQLTDRQQGALEVLGRALTFVVTSEERYNKAAGGLGSRPAPRQSRKAPSNNLPYARGSNR